MMKKDLNTPQGKARRIFKVFRWYLLCLLPFIFFTSFSAWQLYNVVNGAPSQGHNLLSLEQLIIAAPKLFWTGTIVSGTLLIIVAINDLMDLFEKLTKGDQYPKI